MGKSIMLSLVDPVSPERDEDFNRWFNEVHGPEVLKLEGISSLTRYRAVAQFLPESDQPMYRYLAVYEVDDVTTGLRVIQEGASKFTMTDAADMLNAVGLAFEQIYTTK